MRNLRIPDSSDGLIVMGLLLRWPYAWVAFLTMGITIACMMLPDRRGGGEQGASATAANCHDGRGRHRPKDC